MALDFYELSEILHKNIIFEIGHNEFEYLNEVLLEFKNNTGLTIDPYGKTKIHQDHVLLISSIIKKHLYKLNSKIDIQEIEFFNRVHSVDLIKTTKLPVSPVAI